MSFTPPFEASSKGFHPAVAYCCMILKKCGVEFVMSWQLCGELLTPV
jgi:hypothetical protein